MNRSSFDLAQIGTRIALVDRGIVALLASREKLVRLVEEVKRPTGQPIYRKQVETDRIQVVRELAKRYGLNPDFVHALLYFIMTESNKVQAFQRETAVPSSALGGEAWDKELKDNLLAFTDRCAFSYDERYANAFFATRMHTQFEEESIQGLAQAIKGGIALDLGCATGRHAFLLSAYFEKVVGYDISPAMISVARGNALAKKMSHVSFDVRDLEGGIPQPDHLVSLVVMTLGAASDVPGTRNLLKEIARVLKPDGKAFLSFYNKDALIYQWGYIPWLVGLAAEINVDSHCLEVTWEEDGSNTSCFLYAQPYSAEEIGNLLPAGLELASAMTHPILASILPDLLFENEEVRKSTSAIDMRLAREDKNGAYLTVILRKS